MKRLWVVLPVILLIALTTASGWWGNGVSIKESGTLVEIVSNSSGIHTAVSPMLPANKTWNVSFEVRGSVSSLFLEPAYFNGTRFIGARSPVKINVSPAKWEKTSLVVRSESSAQFSAVVLVLNGTGTVEIRDFRASIINVESQPPTATRAGLKPGPTESGQYNPSQSMKGNAINITEENDDLKVTVVVNGTFKPGGKLRTDFYITSKRETFTRIDISLSVYYHGIKVFSYSHPSWREYRPGKTVHIYDESRLPSLTPPGKYKLVFTVTPPEGEPLRITTEIRIKPTLEWFAIVILILTVLFGSVYFVYTNRWVVHAVAGWHSQLSIGQRFVLYSIITLLLSATVLAMGAENTANDVAILAYYLLLTGVINLWIEYFEPRHDNPKLRFAGSMFFAGFLSYVSRNELTVYPAIVLWFIGAFILVKDALKLRLPGKPTRRGYRNKRKYRKLKEVRVLGRTQDGFIIIDTGDGE